MAYVTKHPEARRCGAWDDPRGTKPWTEKDACIVANLNLDMIGEDTVKTNSRFYATRTPDSVPSFLDALLTDVMQQTREANLYAPTGTRQYWQPEMIDYTQGSDHDVFNGLGVPSSMFGHDPDWTHHSSEDNIDKTDASEFRRVGTMAGAAAWWMASASRSEAGQVASIGVTEWALLLSRRMQRGLISGSLDLSSLIAQRISYLQNMRLANRGKATIALAQDGFVQDGDLSLLLPKGSGIGPRRLTLLPISAQFSPHYLAMTRNGGTNKALILQPSAKDCRLSQTSTS
jgi:hypothetical protein